MMSRDVVSIAVSRTTRDHLKRLGRKGESYDALITRLLETLP